MSKLTRILMFDLTRSAVGARRFLFVLIPIVAATFAFAVYRVAFLASIAFPAYASAAFPVKILALAAIATFFTAALRIAGPQDARSFRLYRRAAIAT